MLVHSYACYYNMIWYIPTYGIFLHNHGIKKNMLVYVTTIPLDPNTS